MKVELSEEALDDLAEILAYVSRDNPQAAARLVDGIEATCFRLGGMPGAGTIRDDLKRGLRIFSHRSYLICFRRKNNEMLRIVRVIHGARDINRIHF
jgi:plasmid stabilization system protein ParE